MSGLYSTRMTGAILVATLACLTGAGCDHSQLDTGYRYRPLGASDAQRRGYYAPEYSREAAVAKEADPTADMRRRRPGATSY